MERWTSADVEHLAARAHSRAAGAPADAALAHELRDLEGRVAFTPGARRRFEALLAQLAVASTQPVGVPLDDRPYWLRAPHPLGGHRSADRLPARADVVVVGAGLTGASAAYHLRGATAAGASVVVLDAGDPASEASGRNGGHFEMIPENSVGLYEGLSLERFRFLRRCYPGVPVEVLRAEAERQASAVLAFAVRNRERMRAIIHGDGIACDFAPRGWLFLTHTEREEQAICDEVVLAARHGAPIELWTRRRIRDELGFAASHLGRFVPGDGSYHPFKYACGLLERAIADGVQLFAQVPVERLVTRRSGGQRVVTGEGTIDATTVIVATNAFTAELLPELAAITPRQSQVMVTEHVPDRIRGRIITTEDGPAYFNQPRGGATHGRAPLLMGGGPDRPVADARARRRSPAVHRLLLEVRDRYFPDVAGQPPSAEWVGPMGFTPDQLPAVGWLRPGVVVAAGFNGYGGSYCTAAGEAAAVMAVEGEPPAWAPADVFSPRRLLDQQPLFLQAHDSLWRIVTSLCQRLREVTREVTDAGGDGLVGERRPAARPAGRPPRRTDVAPSELGALAPFRRFDEGELAEVLAAARPIEVPAGRRLFREGDPGATAYVIVRGEVEVTVRARGQDKVLATLGPGAIFGELSLVEREPRSASCTARCDATLLELDRPGCEALLAERSSAALKLLGALNDGLITALRRADRTLLRVERSTRRVLEPDALLV